MIRMGSPKLENRRLEKMLSGLKSLDFTCDIQMVGSELQHESMDLENESLGKKLLRYCIHKHGMGMRLSVLDL